MIEDQRIEALAERLGMEEARRVDPAVTADRVLARLRAARRPRHWWQDPRVLRVAAALVIVASGALLVRQVMSPAAVSLREVVLPVTALTELESGELTKVLDTLLVEAPVSELATATLNDLTEAELRELLAELEG
jgi:hypothetical protein